MVMFSRSLGLHEKISTENIREFIQSKGIWGPFVYFFLYALTSIVFFPGALLSTASGVIWGPVLGTLYTVFAATLAAIIPFSIARCFGRGFMARFMKGNKLEICDKFVSKKGFLFILSVRLIPIFPWDLVNYGAGLCGIRFKHYLFATLIGTIPGSLTYNLIGDSLGKPLDKTRILLIAAVVILILIMVLLYQHKMSTSRDSVANSSV